MGKDIEKASKIHTNYYFQKAHIEKTDYSPYMRYLVNQAGVDFIKSNSTKGNREEFYKEILFGDKNIIKNQKYMKVFTDRAAEELKNMTDPFFINPIYNFYAREDFKRYITLAMESWYIDQNISGILKKCSEISGIDYYKIVNEKEGIVPWQYNKEKISSISEYVDFTSSTDQITEKQIEILKQYGIPEKDFGMYDVGINNEVSLVSTLEKIETFINKLILPEVDPKTINIEIIKHIQKTYNMGKLFPIDKFPETINKINDKAFELIPKDKNTGEIKIQNEDDLKPWQKKKIDTVIGVLMDPYVNKPDESKIKIQDYKMFYILSNNSTQLKCYDQLKTFNRFSKFISNMP